MPFSSFGRLRTDGTSNAPKGKLPYVPFYAVLFWYGRDEEFVETYSGTLNREYYRKYADLYFPRASYYNPDGTFSSLQSNPIIACTGSDAKWNSNTGICIAPVTSMSNTATSLYGTFAHNPSTMVRSQIYNALGSTATDVGLSSTEFYYEQTGDNIHAHDVPNLADAFRSIRYGQLDPDGNYYGLNAISVTPIIRDPRLATVRLGFNDTKLNYLPKNVIVFANNISGANAAYYTQNDSIHDNSANGYILPLIAKNSTDMIGVLGIANTLAMSTQSNTVAPHNHNKTPLTVTYKSTKTGQVGYSLVDAGDHSHTITYTANVALRSKILKAWITNNDQTPIANGIIIGYSINNDTAGFSGIGSNSANLPSYWHFCNGNNGTPDLRGYYIYANFDPANTYHNRVYSSSNSMLITSIAMQAAGNHSHLGPTIGVDGGIGTATDIGSHSFEDYLDHTHTQSTVDNFKKNKTDTSNTINVKVGQTYSYTPPTVNFAFIMYNDTIVK